MSKPPPKPLPPFPRVLLRMHGAVVLDKIDGMIIEADSRTIAVEVEEDPVDTILITAKVVEEDNNNEVMIPIIVILIEEDGVDEEVVVVVFVSHNRIGGRRPRNPPF